MKLFIYVPDQVQEYVPICAETGKWEDEAYQLLDSKYASQYEDVQAAITEQFCAGQQRGHIAPDVFWQVA